MCSLDDNLGPYFAQPSPAGTSPVLRMDALLYPILIIGKPLHLTSLWLLLQCEPIFAFDLPRYFPPNSASISVVLNLYLTGSQAAHEKFLGRQWLNSQLPRPYSRPIKDESTICKGEMQASIFFKSDINVQPRLRTSIV